MTRRYREFYALHNVMASSMGAAEPPFPPKSFFNNTFDSNFIKVRRAQLQQYLRELVAQPAALRSSSLRKFLEIAEEDLRVSPRASPVRQRRDHDRERKKEERVAEDDDQTVSSGEGAEARIKTLERALRSAREKIKQKDQIIAQQM